MNDLLAIISSVISGGATGLLGILLQKFFEFKTKQLEIEVVKLNHANALALAASETERTRMRADADQAIADRAATARENEAREDGLARENEAISRSLVASFDHDRASYMEKGAQLGKGKAAKLSLVLMALVDFSRGILRPGLTIHLTVIVTLMFSQMLVLLQLQGHEWGAGELVPIVKMIVNTILYCWTTCVVWWFGTRAPQQAK